MKEIFHEAALCGNDVGQRTLLPLYIREHGHRGGLQEVQSIMMGPAEDPNLRVQEVAVEYHQQYSHNTLDSLKGSC